mgnify:CR=1 FL=1
MSSGEQAKIKPYLEDLVVRSYLEGEPATKRQGLLDCSLGVNLTAGVSEKVVEAAKQYEWSGMWHYGDPTYKDLKRKISGFWSNYADLKIEQIQIGHGASAVLEKLSKIFVSPGSKVLGYIPQWPDYASCVNTYGGSYEAVSLGPEEKFKFHVETLIVKINGEYCLIYIDNPNNPTGQLISLQEIEQVLKQAQKKGVVVVIDEAYGDYVGKGNSATNLINKYQNLVVVRSFSKGLGLAGLRIGYGVFPADLSHCYNKVAVPLPISRVSCYLAQVALSNEDFMQSCQRKVQTEKAKLIEGLRDKGYIISETFELCPIFVMGHKNRDINLKDELLGKSILTVSGHEFKNLGSNYVRVNTPARAEEFLARL